MDQQPPRNGSEVSEESSAVVMGHGAGAWSPISSYHCEKEKLPPKAWQSRSLTPAQIPAGEGSLLPSATAHVTDRDCPGT